MISRFFDNFPFFFVGALALIIVAAPVLAYIESKSSVNCIVCCKTSARENMCRLTRSGGAQAYICKECLRNHLKEGNHHELGVQHIQPQD